MSDSLKKFFINVSGTHLGFDIKEDTGNIDIEGLNILDDYLDNDAFITLYVSKVNDKKCIEFRRELLAQSTLDRIVVFYKNNPTTLTEDNFLSSMQVTSLQGPPTTALYHTLNHVFSPLIIKNERRSLNQNNIERQLVNLQTGLRTAILTGHSDLNPLKSVDPNSLTVVFSLEHEVEFWNNVATTSKNVDLRATSATLRDILTPLSKYFSILEALPLPDLEDVLENAHNILDDLWRHEPPYPKTRMEHLMDIITSHVCQCILKQASKCNFWSEEYNTMRDSLEQCINAGTRWVTTCKQLTEIFWPNYSLHAWTGDSYMPHNLIDLLTRLDEVLKARIVHKQLIRLLTISEQNDLSTGTMFKPFQEIQILKYGNQNEREWKTAKKQFEYLLQPVEQCVALKLKKQLSSMDANTRQLLHEFGRYSELISRPTLKQSLQNERQYLLTALKEYIKQLAAQTAETQMISSKYDTSQIVSEILAARQMEAKALEVQKIAGKLLNDLTSYEDLNHSVSDLITNLRQQHNEMFDSWTSEISAQIKHETISLKETDSVVRFSKDKLMRVNYSHRFVSLISEIRQLSAMGYKIPSCIEDIGAHAKKFMKYANTLEQIANFHNTIGDRMIPSQRPMMLTSALNLSRLVQEEEVVSWGDIKSVEKYIENLKYAVENLSKENNILTTYHLQIMEKIKTLEDVDIIKSYQKWKDTAKLIRDTLSQVQQKGFKSMQSWKLDIDRKLCRVLEIQYKKSLDTLHMYLPEIHADLIYRESHLQFSPDEKTLKEKYEQQLKRFLDIPKSFRGVSDSVESNIFADIIDRCKDDLGKVNKNTDNLFLQLKDVVKHWESWLTMESLNTSNLVTWEHWDLHFRASKTFGQEIAKLPSTEERVGCFIISLSRLRSDLESHNRSYWDRLILSLKDSIINDVVKLQQYIDSSTATLNRQPLTLEQIGEADASHANILKDKPEMEKLYKEMIKKSQILASWTREQIDSVNRLQAAWDRLQSLLENHEHIISKQMQTIKTTLNIASENLNNEIERFAAKWDQVKPRPNSGQISNDSLSELHKYLENIRQKKEQWKELMDQKDKIISDATKFGMIQVDFPLCSEIEEDLLMQEDTWLLFEEFYLDLEKICNEEWIVFRKKSYRLDEFLTDWQDRLQKLENTALTTRMLKEIHKYQATIPSLKYVRGEDFTEKHWMDVYNLLGMIPKGIDILNLKDFLDVSDALINHITELQVICKKAASEVIVRQALAELDQWEVQSHFVLSEHLDSNKKQILLIKDFKDILTKIGDNQSLLQSVKNSADYESFSERAALWESRLFDLDQHLTALAKIQRKWVYLEPIFGGGTLGQERSRFERLDRDFRVLIKFIEKDARVCALCRYPNLTSVLDNLHDQLARCQKSLDDFLKDKRDKFPRFLFLGDDDLLEIVGQSSKEHVIQSHLKKMFAGIHSIKLDDAGKKIVAICSLEGEVVWLNNSILLNQPVEDWLNALVKEMQISLKNLLNMCLNDGQNLDPLKYPSQILCLADDITFTTKCEQAINGMTLPPLLASYKTQLNHYSSLELNDDEAKGSNILELKLKALLLDTIHHINVIEELIDDNVTRIDDWTWQKQLRFYRNSSGEITINMVNAKMEYAYEYLGNAPKLVRTPLTDQCFLTLTQGMHLGMGGNPYGPAGTGKTESVKALGALLGRQVLVFNCDEGIDAPSMCRILSGLVRTGAWGCFDEFNRLDEATLSTISMQIQPIQNALKERRETVRISDQEVKVNVHCGIFVTLNPAGGGYGARNRLPDNLKQLFRPIVMTHPDHEQIARTLLHCDGYQNADVIGRKLVEIFSLSGQLLSKQQHYDWGLRALKTVLGGCSRALRKLKNVNRSAINEFGLVVQALRMDTMSKLTFSDGEKFEALLKCVFPDLVSNTSSHETLLKILEDSCIELGLVVNKRQINKCIEFYEQLKQRMGVAIVGPASSGKTSVRNILFHALNKMGRVLKQKVLNPKSLARRELLGQIDLDTRQWTDGVLTLYSLQVTSEPLDVWSWIVCDGDVDPEWVESLNSVLDDNRLLSLPSGWRIQFGPNVNFIFETHDLSHASPATISRMGIVFLSEEDMNVEDFITKFWNTHTDVSEMVKHYVNDYYPKALEWILNEGEKIIPSSKIGVTKTALSQLIDVTSKAQFAVQVVNSLGGQLQQDFKEIFSQQIFEWTNENQPALPAKAYYNKDRNIVESYYINVTQTIDDIEDGTTLILTTQVCQAIDYLRLWLKPGNEQHFLLIGSHGSAKSLVLKSLIRERSDTDIAVVHCSAHITTKYVIHKLAQHCIVVSSNKGKMYKPKKGHLVMYFKNMHLLKCDQWGTNLLIQFLQQFISYRGFFDNSLEWVGIENITVVGSLSPTNKLSIRFSSLVHIYSIDMPEREELTLICNVHVTAVLRKILPENQTWTKSKISKLTTTILSIYNEVKETFTAIEYQHYALSPHEIIKWCNGILRYKNDNNDDVEQFILEALSYEALRVFGDKLVNETDREKLHKIINDAILNVWGKTAILKTIDRHFYVPTAKINSLKSVISLTKLNEVDWSNLVKKSISQYEREGEQLDVVITAELLQLSANISKILTDTGGNTLLVGPSGIGRKTSVRIVSAFQSAKLLIPASSNQPQFNNDLKLAMQQSGIEDEHVYVLLEDHLLRNETILNVVNTILVSSEVPGLFNPAEFDSLISGLREEAVRENFEGNLSDFFVKRVKNKLHLIICLDEENESLWNILENFPALYQQCSVIWLKKWSQNTMKNIPNLLIDNINGSQNSNESVEISNWFNDIHATIESKTAAPLRYVQLIKVYAKIYLEKKNMILNKKNKLQVGVTKLTEARNVVAELKLKAAEQQEKLKEKQEKANAALDMISTTMKNANTHKQEMEVLKQHTEKENEQLIKRKKEIELELAEVEPLIQEARAAVGNIKPESLSEIRSLRAPPDVIRDILEGVLRLMGIQDTSWNSMKTFLAKRGVKEDIRSFDASKINRDSRLAVERLMQNKSDSFDPKASKRASVAAAPLASWVTANVRYSHVMDKIKPLSKEQNRLKRNLDDAKSQLGELSAGLTDVDTTVAKLKEQLSTYTKEAAEIEIHLNQAQETLTAAEGLVGKLNDEYERWQSQLKDLSQQLQQLSVNCLLAAAFITYLSSEPENVRNRIVTDWMKVVQVKSFNFEEFMTSEREQLQWQSEGLSTDQLSIQNAIIILNSNLCSLIVDPTNVASKWVKTHFRHKTVECVTQNSPKFNTTIELAIRFGKLLIIEEVDIISPILLPILRREFIHHGERKLIRLNGKLFDYHNDFQLMLSSRNTHLKLTPDLSSVITLVNFTITHAGLTEQLLINAIRQENPELEERRKQLLREREELQEKQFMLQNRLLEDLANSSGDILQNKNLLASLNETKASSNSITSALAESKLVQNKLQEEYEIYKEISLFGSTLYFAALDFSKINVLYLLSISSYIKLFLKSLMSLQGVQNTFGFLQRMIIQTLYQYMGRGIFKVDRLMFVLHLLYKIYPNQISEEEWKFFLGYTLESKLEKINDNIPTWLATHTAHQVSFLQTSFPTLYNSLNLNEQSIWKSFMDSSDCEANFPTHCKVSEFQKVLIVQALRPDRLYSALLLFVMRITGLKNINLDVLQLSQILQESTLSEPILLLTTSGNDPSQEIRNLAEQKIGLENYTEIAMGAGQETTAISILQESAKSGRWLTLKNLHLVTSWLPELSQNLHKITSHANFRLWLVTETHCLFSPVLSQNCLKVAYEAPQGFKNNLLRIYATWGPEYIKKLQPTSARIFFVICCVHALLQERRNYIPQGWSKWYEFSDIDLSTALKLSEEIWSNHNANVPWKYFKGLCADAVYGGRIEYIEDFCILDAYLEQYFNDTVLSHRWKPFKLNNPISMSTNYQDYVNAVMQLSSRDLPSYFGLPENVDRSWERNVSHDIIMKLKDLYQHKSISLKFDRQLWHKGLIPYMTLWKKLNQGQDFVKINLNTCVNETENPINEFIFEEFCNAIRLVQKIHKYFTILNRSIRGSSPPEKEFIEVANNLLNQQTPILWLKIWPGPTDPNKYLRTIITKTTNISKWKNEQIDYFFKTPMNLSFLFNPETFLAAFKLHFSRMYNVPVDELVLQTSWKVTQDAITLTGLLMEGAIFDGFLLTSCTQLSETIVTIPNCYISWLHKKIDVVSEKIIDVPLFYSLNREKRVTSLQVPCNAREKDKWIQAGLALFLSY